MYNEELVKLFVNESSKNYPSAKKLIEEYVHNYCEIHSYVFMRDITSFIPAIL